MSETADFTKIVRLGTVVEFQDRRMSVFCKIEFKDGRLSITGVEGPKANGDCKGGAGQIDMHMDGDYLAGMDFAPGWTYDTVQRFVDTWQRWHLNDMRAGSPAQSAELRKHTYPGSVAGSYFKWAKQVLAAVELLHDDSYTVLTNTCDNCGQQLSVAGLVHVKSEHEHACAKAEYKMVPYSYGSAWLKEEVPADVLDFLRNLPDTDRTPAWV